MNIKITYDWLLEYLDTDADVDELQRYLSMCGPSVERVEKVGRNSVLDIEITSNRVDAASVVGLARETGAILPMFNLAAKFKPIKITRPMAPNKPTHTLEIVDSEKYCRRVMAIVLDGCTVKSSPDFIKKRLEACGVRSLSNLIDITNYVMLEVGHPTHVFDYDLVKTGKLSFRNARKGERLITLDEQTRVLDETDVVIDDGTGRIIDLPGIMGTVSSSVTDKTKRVIFFIESNDANVIRKTSMRLPLRSPAATINEKDPDPELVEVAFNRGIELLQKYANGIVSSNIYDIYPKPRKAKSMTVALSDIHRIIGVSIETHTIKKILSSLGFTITSSNNEELNITVPTFRISDVSIPQDIAEEVARVYGYYRLPSVVQKTGVITQPKYLGDRFFYENKIKYLLKHLGWHESYNYSLISKKDLENFALSPNDHLRLSNAISEEIEFLRTSLIPSLIKNVKINEGRREMLRFFELAKVYLPQKNDLPSELHRLTLSANTDYVDVKATVEAVFRELNVTAEFFPVSNNHYLSKNKAAVIEVNGACVGDIGQLDESHRLNMSLKKPVFVAELYIDSMMDLYATMLSTFRPINPYAVIKLDLTIDIKPGKYYEELVQNIRKSATLLTDIQFVTFYKNHLTLRLFFTSTARNITEDEAKVELEKIKKML